VDMRAERLPRVPSEHLPCLAPDEAAGGAPAVCGTRGRNVCGAASEEAGADPAVCGCRLAPEVTRMSCFVYVIRVGVDEPTPERQSAVRDRVMRHLQEPKGGGDPAFPR